MKSDKVSLTLTPLHNLYKISKLQAQLVCILTDKVVHSCITTSKDKLYYSK